MASPERPSINPPEIQALWVTQEGAPTRWKATGYVDGVGWLEAWGTSLIGAMEALHVLAAQRVAQPADHEAGTDREKLMSDDFPPYPLIRHLPPEPVEPTPADWVPATFILVGSMLRPQDVTPAVSLLATLLLRVLGTDASSLASAPEMGHWLLGQRERSPAGRPRRTKFFRSADDFRDTCITLIQTVDHKRPGHELTRPLFAELLAVHLRSHVLVDDDKHSAAGARKAFSRYCKRYGYSFDELLRLARTRD
jgi:hypothetical protein